MRKSRGIGTLRTIPISITIDRHIAPHIVRPTNPNTISAAVEVIIPAVILSETVEEETAEVEEETAEVAEETVVGEEETEVAEETAEVEVIKIQILNTN